MFVRIVCAGRVKLRAKRRGCWRTLCWSSSTSANLRRRSPFFMGHKDGSRTVL